MIYLVDPDDESAVEVDETLFANLLSDQNALRLVVLNSCEGARTTLTDPYAGVATTLIQLGVPAVVAMQFEISDRAAIVFAEELYANLIARRDPIDASVAEARKAVYSDVDRVEWATPVLFVRDPDVELFRFADHPATEEPAPIPWWRRLGAGRRPVVLAPVVTALVAAAVLGLVLPRCGDDVRSDAATTTVASTASAALGFPTVTVGDEGPLVTALQRLLVEQGHDVDVTGFFDDATEGAVKAVEAATNIPVDGIVGRVTWQQLAAPIRRGDRGSAVLGAEELLAGLGFDVVPDDQFSTATQSVVTDFQRRNGLAVDGIVDIDTWRVLLALTARVPATSAPTTG